ncbi:hypothetical protein [Klenkia brasiliensis]|uniref:hypothetical protein n=1 Tax=Klenkia brasiliensis TaxID=333142 RepID=UPI001041F5CE|nr:hypothetical protein [Klenkia brasiliensis]
MVQLAHHVMADPAVRSAEVLDAALTILGAAVDPADRTTVLDFARTRQPHMRGHYLVRLSGDIGADEARKIVDVLAETRSSGAEPEHWKPVTLLLRRLPLDVLAAFIDSPFTQGRGRAPLLEAGLIGTLGAARLQEVLEQLTSVEVVTELVERAARDLPQDQLVDFSVWAHHRYPASLCFALRQRLIGDLSDSHYFTRGEERRAQAVEGLWASGLAGTEADAIADELIAVTDPDDLATRAADVTTSRAASQLGAAAAKLLAAQHPNDTPGGRQLIEAAARSLRAMTVDLLKDFAAGLVRTATGTPAEGRLSGPLVDAVIGHPDAIAAFAAEGGSDVLTLHAARTPDQAAAVLLSASAHLNAAQACTLLGVAPALDRPGNSPNTAPGVNWTTTNPSIYLRLLDAADTWDEATFGVLGQALRALDEPEARQPSTEVLLRALSHGESRGLADHLGEATTDHIRRLLEQRNPEVLRAACDWVRRLDIDADGADIGRAQLVLAADTRRNGRNADISQLRADLAHRHAELAQDLTLEAGQRVAHLETAATLADNEARDAAVVLVESRTTAIRRAAAHVLAETPGSPEEHATLNILIANEDDAEVAHLLQTALHRLVSGDAGEALRNLMDLLGLPTRGLNVDVLIPNQAHRERFTLWVDRARARSSNTGDPSAFIDATINIADQMADLAVVAASDAGQNVALRPDQVEGIRVNNKPRPDAGVLVTQQQRTQLFPWFSSVAALRSKRAAHPSPLGTTTPLHFGDEDQLVARGLLKQIAEGWIESMYAHASK